MKTVKSPATFGLSGTFALPVIVKELLACLNIWLQRVDLYGSAAFNKLEPKTLTS